MTTIDPVTVCTVSWASKNTADKYTSKAIEKHEAIVLTTAFECWYTKLTVRPTNAFTITIRIACMLSMPTSKLVEGNLKKCNPALLSVPILYSITFCRASGHEYCLIVLEFRTDVNVVMDKAINMIRYV